MLNLSKETAVDTLLWQIFDHFISHMLAISPAESEKLKQQRIVRAKLRLVPKLTTRQLSGAKYACIPTRKLVLSRFLSKCAF